MPFIYPRMVRFQETDAAGVVYFANILPICHEAYEASLYATGFALHSFFSNPDFAVPIAHATVDFYRPLMVGDQLNISLRPSSLSESEFEIRYEVFLQNKPERSTCQALTRHVCIHPTARTRQALPASLNSWLQQWH